MEKGVLGNDGVSGKVTIGVFGSEGPQTTPG